MSKRRPRPEGEVSREAAEFGRMLQDAFACQAMGERPEMPHHRGYGFSFRIDLLRINVVDFIRPFLGVTQTWGPVTVHIPGTLAWENGVENGRRVLTFNEPLSAKFRRWIRLDVELLSVALSFVDGVTFSVRWTPLGLLSVTKDVTFPFDFTSPN